MFNNIRWIKQWMLGIVVFLISASVLRGSPKEGMSDRPNFMFILVDDLGWKDIGSFGSTFYETPNVNALAAEGTRFTNAYAASPVCSPTRASIMTGKNPARMATTDWFGAPQPDEVQNHWTRNKPMLPAPYQEHLPLEEKTIAEALKEHGYVTFFAGKWHLGHDEKYWPEHQGFDINKGGFFKGSPVRNNTANGYFSPYGNPRLTDGPEGEHLPDRLAEETIRFVEANKDQPFLAYLSFYSVHTPLMTTKALEAKYERKKKELGLVNTWGEEGSRKVRQVQAHSVYAGMIEAMDQAVGKVMRSIHQLGLEENTIVIFMSDNGGLSTSEGHPTSNMPLRAGKGWMYEGGIREPMIIKWPGVTRPGSVSSEPVISMDFYPTMLEAAGIELIPGQHIDGKSLVPLLKGQHMNRGPLYWHYPHYGNQGGAPSGAVRRGNYKLIEFYEDNHIELYDLVSDVGEQHNLAGERPELATELRQMLHNWRDSVNVRMPVHRN